MVNAEIERMLFDKGVRPTANRILVMKELMKATHPISLADLEVLMGLTMNKASIFRVLETFAAHDIVHEIEDGSRSLKYELCHSADHNSENDQHVHFYCVKCKQTYCFDEVRTPMIDVPDGFRPHSINYMIKGVCPKCED